jgi:hypothetical protein
MTKNLKVILKSINDSKVTRNEFMYAIEIILEEMIPKYMLGIISERISKPNFWKNEVIKHLISLKYLMGDDTKTSFKNKRKVFDETLEYVLLSSRCYFVNTKNILTKYYPELIWKIHKIDLDVNKEIQNLFKKEKE